MYPNGQGRVLPTSVCKEKKPQIDTCNPLRLCKFTWSARGGKAPPRKLPTRLLKALNYLGFDSERGSSYFFPCFFFL